MSVDEIGHVCLEAAWAFGTVSKEGPCLLAVEASARHDKDGRNGKQKRQRTGRLLRNAHKGLYDLSCNETCVSSQKKKEGSLAEGGFIG
jgi:hypothetical protein